MPHAAARWLPLSTLALALLSAPAAETPGVVIRAAQPPLSVGGDCNRPAIWVDGRLRVYESPYPQGEFNGGVASYRTGPSLLELTQSVPVAPDRATLGKAKLRAFGPWFESVIVDGDGVLWAYYHAEFVHQDCPKEKGDRIHPRIGAQVSRDRGQTWLDLGIVIDTPAGSDELANPGLGYGFTGGNGDCSAILDPAKEFVYFFFSQYGSAAEVQGLAVARMRWADRAAPVGKVAKWHQGAWQEPGLGGQATPFLANAGDAHVRRGAQDYWWGPAVHWNTHLQRYVILVNRSNTPAFTFAGGVANWYLTSPSLDDPKQWDQPRALPFPDGYQGGWYPQVIGTQPGETDKLASEVARLFVAGESRWEIRFLLPGEQPPGP